MLRVRFAAGIYVKCVFFNEKWAQAGDNTHVPGKVHTEILMTNKLFFLLLSLFFLCHKADFELQTG